MFVARYRKIWFTLSAILIALSIFGAWKYRFNYSIDFKGGTITEVRYSGARPDKTLLESEISKLDLGGVSVRPTENDRYTVRTRELADAERTALTDTLSLHGSAPLSIERQNTIGPVAGAELKSK